MWSRQRSASVIDESEIRKFPFRRLQTTVDRFIKILQIDIDRLRQHKYNVDKYTRYGDHRLLNREHINSSRTVQQLRANLVELDRTRLQVEDQDVREFDRRTARVRDDAGQLLAEFLEQCAVEGKAMKRRAISRQSSSAESSPTLHDFEELPSSEKVAQMQCTADLESEYEAMLEAERSWKRLQNDLEDLNDLMKDLCLLVHEQGETLDTIEDNIDRSLVDVKQGNEHLAKASRLKTALYPLAGGLVGCAVGGPVGFVAGMKIGLAAAVGGGILGVTSGRFLKRYNNKSDDSSIELQKIPAAKSCPSNLNKL